MTSFTLAAWPSRGAEFSACLRWRYLLWRERRSFLPSRGAVSFVLLNPSTADAREDDPTVRRCLAFALAWGFSRVDVVNLFGFRSTDPLALESVADPIGRGNDATIAESAARASLVVAGWGSFGMSSARAADVIKGPLKGVRLHALRSNADGSPGHPLYVPASAVPFPWDPPIGQIE